jgi:hypothetical protein
MTLWAQGGTLWGQGGTLVYVTGSSPSSPTGPQFPLLGSLLVGGQSNYTIGAFQSDCARYDMAIFGCYYQYSNPASLVNAIKAINPNILLGNYTIVTDALATSAESGYLATQKGPSGIGDWWAYNAAGTSTGKPNITDFVTPDSNGNVVGQYAAGWDYTNIIGDGANWDIWFSDNNFYQPRITADWNRSGTNVAPGSTSPYNVDSAYRTGQVNYYNKAKSLMPAATGNCKWIMANCDSDLGCGHYHIGYPTYTEFTNVLHGGLMEGAIGYTWSCENLNGTAETILWYSGLTSKLLSPQYVMFCHNIPGPGNTTVMTGYVGSTTDYQTFRYGFAMCLIAGNGYYTPTDNGTEYGTMYWFDEFDLAGTSTSKWLGTAVDPPQTTSWSNGVWMRRFAHGLALMNPRGNGSQTVTPPSGYQRISGTQDSTTNNGATVTSTVTLADRDGLLLVKST